jgi:hypothetical protein
MSQCGLYLIFVSIRHLSTMIYLSFYVATYM